MTKRAPDTAAAVRHLRFWSVSLLVFLVALFFLREVLLPFVAGMAVAYLLDPVCDRLEAWKLSRTLATGVLTVAFLVIAALAVLLVVPTLINQITGLVGRLPQLFAHLRETIGALLVVLETRLDPAIVERLQGAVMGSADQVVGWITALFTRLLSGGVALANLLSLLFITPVVAFYLLRDWDGIVARVDSWLPRAHLETLRELARETDEILAGFVRGQGTVCLILGLFYAIGLSLAGLDFGLIVGLGAGLLSFIPFVGSIVGLLLSVGLAVFQFGEWLPIAIVAGIFFAGQAIEGNVLTPKLVGDRVKLHPVWVIFALLAGGALFGFVGVLLAVPAAAVIGVGVRFGVDRYMASPYYDASGSTPGEGGNEVSQ